MTPVTFSGLMVLGAGWLVVVVVLLLLLDGSCSVTGWSHHHHHHHHSNGWNRRDVLTQTTSLVVASAILPISADAAAQLDVNNALAREYTAFPG